MNVQPRYEVEKVTGKFIRTFHVIQWEEHFAGYDEEGNELTKKVPKKKAIEKEVKHKYIVRTPKLDEFHVWDEHDLIAKGISPDGKASRIDMDTGEVIEEVPLSLKERIRHRSHRGR